MKYALAFVFIFALNAYSQESKTEPASKEQPAAIAPAPEPEEDYQVDYEEEPDPELEPPSPKKSSKKSPRAANTAKTTDKTVSTQGSRAKNRFVFPAKSETKSVYKKNGVPLDVDTD